MQQGAPYVGDSGTDISPSLHKWKRVKGREMNLDITSQKTTISNRSAQQEKQLQHGDTAGVEG